MNLLAHRNRCRNDDALFLFAQCILNRIISHGQSFVRSWEFNNENQTLIYQAKQKNIYELISYLCLAATFNGGQTCFGFFPKQDSFICLWCFRTHIQFRSVQRYKYKGKINEPLSIWMEISVNIFVICVFFVVFLFEYNKTSAFLFSLNNLKDEFSKVFILLTFCHRCLIFFIC